KVEFESVSRLSSQKFKIQAIPNVFALRKSYEHGFTKKHDSHKLCAMSRAESTFDRFFVQYLRNSKYWPFPMYSTMESRMSTILRKKATVINFAQSQVSIGFSCTVS
ncbi:hypothetical protein B296_00038121, partial [Ensete ventricosum]